jgi:hypothetical protein
MNEITGSAERPQIGPPPPDAARGTLSEAWYRALYGHETKHAPTPAVSRAGAPAGAGASARMPSSRAAAGSPRALQTLRVDLAAAGKPRTLTVANITRLRAPKIAAPAAPARPGHAQLARRSIYRLELPGGNLEFLVQRRGNRVHLVALGDGALGGRMASALQRARAALLAHGLRLEAYAKAEDAS